MTDREAYQQYMAELIREGHRLWNEGIGDEHGERENPGVGHELGGILPFALIAGGLFLFRHQIGSTLSGLGSTIGAHAAAVTSGTPAASPSSAAAIACPPGSGAGCGNYNTTPPTTGAGWYQVRSQCDAAIRSWCTDSNCNQNGNVNCNGINDATALAIARASQAQGGGWPSGVRHCKTTQGEGLYAWGGGLEYAAGRAIAPGDCYS